jgi:hypothetical protein
MRTGGARGRRGGIGPFGAGPDRDVPRGEIDDGGGDEEWGNTARTVFQKCLVLALDHLKTTDPTAYIDADLFRSLFGDLKTGHIERVFGSRNGQMDEASHLFDLFFLNENRRIKMLDLAGDARVEQACIEGFDRRDAAAALKQRLPRLRSGVAHCGDEADACNYDSAGNDNSPSSAGLRLSQAGQRPLHDSDHEILNHGDLPRRSTPRRRDYFFFASI